MIATANPKTIARREQMRIKYENLNIRVEDTRIELSGYNRIESTNTSIISYQEEIEGLYCINPKFLYRNSDFSDNNKSCLNIYWNCNQCMICDKRRKLHIMKQIDKRFRYHEHHSRLKEDELYTLTVDLVNEGDFSKLSKQIKYIQNGENNQLMWLIKDTNKSRITFLMKGMVGETSFTTPGVVEQTKITKDEVIEMINVRDKYRFLGIFYNKVPDVEFAGMTKEEIDELSRVKTIPKKKCDCGKLLIEEHTIRAAKNEYDFDAYVEPEEHYEDEHIKFKKKYNI